MLNNQIEKRTKDTLHGAGIFAKAPIQKGTVIWKRTGATYTLEEYNNWSDLPKSYGFQCGESKFSLDEDDWKFVNHSCNPSAWFTRNFQLQARIDLNENDEITYDYSTTEVINKMEMACLCGAHNCRGVITNLDHLRPEWQKFFGTTLPDYVLAAIKSQQNNC
jgi:SET domain-containing protein